MALREQFTNGVVTTLTSAITAGSTAIKVTSVVGLSSDGYSRFQVGTEIIGVGLNGTDTWSTQVNRGLEGTVAASHTSGTGVYQRPTAGSFDAMVGVYGSTVLVGAVRDINFVADTTGGGLGVTLTTGPFSTGMVNVKIPTYYSTAPTIQFSTVAAPGSTGVILRSDATLAVFDGVTPSTGGIGSAASSGSAAFAARRDHVHGSLTLPQQALVPYYTGYTTNPPNSSDITALFGASSSQIVSSTQAFVGVLNTSGGSTQVWIVVSFGSTSWWRAELSLAT